MREGQGGTRWVVAIMGGHDDPLLVERLVANLIENAVRHNVNAAPRAGGGLRIEIGFPAAA